MDNPNMFDPLDEEATNVLSVRAASLIGGKTAASDHATPLQMDSKLTGCLQKH